MHQAAEKLIGRQGSELGELLRVADSYIHNQAEQTKQTEQENNEDDFFTDPKKAVDKAIQNHPKIKQAEQASLEMQRAKALSALKEKHSDLYYGVRGTYGTMGIITRVKMKLVDC